MDVKQDIHNTRVRTLDTQGLRNEFLAEKVLIADEHAMVYSRIGRTIIGGIIPVTRTVSVGGEVNEQLGVSYFPKRRGLDVTNIGGAGMIAVDGQCYGIGHRDALYVGKGAREVIFTGIGTATPARFYYNCTSAHATYPTKKAIPDKVSPVTLDDNLTSNRRTVNRYFVPDVLETCQLSIGLTELAPGNLWNVILCHTHEHRMEVYFYFSMDDNTRILHMMGQPQETRHIVIHNEQAVISPGQSVHSDVETKTYTFVWDMIGENQVFDNMDHVAVKDLRQLWA